MDYGKFMMLNSMLLHRVQGRSVKQALVFDQSIT